MNRQFVFNKAVYNILKQNARAVGKTGSCVYKDGERRCAVGWLLTEEEALVTQTMPSMTAVKLLQHLPAVADRLQVDMNEEYKGSDREFLSRLQALHDDMTAFDRDAFRQRAYGFSQAMGFGAGWLLETGISVYFDGEDHPPLNKVFEA